MQSTLNLADPKHSDIPYEKIKFSDGQVSIKLHKDLKTISVSDPIFILTRFNSYEDLFYILAATDVLRNNGYKHIYLGIACFFGQRSDQRFSPLQSFDLKIITDIINAQNYNSVILNEPHSYVLPGLVNQSKIVPPEFFFKFVIETMKVKGYPEFTVVSPDAGAYKRISHYLPQFKVPMVAANKFRDSEDVPHVVLNGDVKDKVCLIVDDYCDGGRTFIQLAQQLKGAGATNVVLAVVHGLYSYGLSPILEHIDLIISTNSIKQIGGDPDNKEANYIVQQDVIGK